MLQDLNVKIIQPVYAKCLKFFLYLITAKNKEIINKCYLEILKRDPDQVGFLHFLSIMKTPINPNGLDENGLRRQIKESVEFKLLKLTTTIYENKLFIYQYYKKLLERRPDQTGLNYYLNKMKNPLNPQGINRRELIKTIKNSDEYKLKNLKELARSYDKKPKYSHKGLYNIKYLIRPNSILDAAIVKNGVYDKWLCSRLKRLINKNAVIFDIGANAGLLSLPFAKIHVPKGIVYAFEPDNEVVKQLKRNIKLNCFRNIIVRELALQNNAAISKIKLYKNRAIHDNGLRNDGLSTIEEKSTYKISTRIVNASTVDRFVKENNIDKLEFIKIDTEGSEYKVLKGAINTIKKFHPIILYEYQPIIGRSIHFKNIKESFRLINKMGYKQYLRIKNKKPCLVSLKKYSNNLPTGDIICFPYRSLTVLS